MDGTNMENSSVEQGKTFTKQRKPVEKARSFKATLVNAQTQSMECEKQRNSLQEISPLAAFFKCRKNH